MKKKLSFLFLLIASWATAQQQTVTYSINPAAFNEDEEITITFQGSSINEATWGVSNNALYLWAWSFDTNFQNIQDSPTNGAWTNSNEANRLTYNSGTDTYSITFTPTTFYNRTGIGRIGFLVKAKDGTGDKKSQDILVDVGAFQLTLTSPANELTILPSAQNITIEATSSLPANFTLKANEVVVNTSASASTSYNFVYNVAVNTHFTLEATNNGDTQTRSFRVVITPTVTEEPVPSGMLDGINLDPSDATKATLVLFAPGKQFVHLIGDFNNWEINDAYLLKKDSAKNRFWIELTGLTPQFKHMFQYLVDFSINIADPYSTTILDPFNDQFIDAVTYPNLPAYPSAFTTEAVTLLRTGDPAYTWQTTGYQRPARTDMVVYEVLIRDFDALHSFNAVKNRLDYLQGLGVNVLEFMPVSEFDGNESWGYNPSFHMALDKYYGTATAFKELIDECHARGIAVVLDVVYNHASGQNPFFRLWNNSNGGTGGQATTDNPFFNQQATHSYSVFNDFNHQSQATRDYVKRTVDYWINEFKIDGFRWDLTKGFTQNCPPGANQESCTNSYNADRVAVLKEYADYQWASDPDFYVIFEHLGVGGSADEEKEWVEYRLGEGKGIMFWDKQNPQYSEAVMGYHDSNKSNFSGASYKVKGWPAPSNIAYMESHDEERMTYRMLQFGNSNGSYNTKNLSTALNRLEMAGAFFFTIPGPKMIWQFGELGYDVSIDFNGRTGNKPIRWEYADDPNRKAVYDLWAKLIQLKLNEPIFKTEDFTIDAGATTGLKKIQLTLSNAANDEVKYVTVIGNFGVTAQSINPNFQQTGIWYNFLNGNLKYTVTNATEPITLQPGEFRVYGDKPTAVFPDLNPPDEDNDGVLDADDLCPGTPLGTVVDVTGCEIFSLPANNFTVAGTGETCRNQDNGKITAQVAQLLNYTVTVTGSGGFSETASFNTSSWELTGLEAGAYEVCFEVDGITGYRQCFNVNISEPEDLSVLSKVNESSKTATLSLKGGSVYMVTLNGVTSETTATEITLPLNNGINTVKVSTGLDCQGVFEKTILIGNEFTYYPNPVKNVLNIILDDENTAACNIDVYSFDGRLLIQKKENATNKSVSLNVAALQTGHYFVVVNNGISVKTLKIVKE